LEDETAGLPKDDAFGMPGFFVERSKVYDIYNNIYKNILSLLYCVYRGKEAARHARLTVFTAFCSLL